MDMIRCESDPGRYQCPFQLESTRAVRLVSLDGRPLRNLTRRRSRAQLFLPAPTRRQLVSQKKIGDA